MSILSEDDIFRQALEPVFAWYQVKCDKTVGGICPNSAADDIYHTKIFDGISEKQFRKAVNRTIVEVIKEYFVRWHYDWPESVIRTGWSNPLYEYDRDNPAYYINVLVKDTVWMRVKISKRTKRMDDDIIRRYF